jgi:hypothetical protein
MGDMNATITIAWLIVAVTDYSGGDPITRFERIPMQTMEACDIAAGMVWNGARDVTCEEQTITVPRPKPRPVNLGVEYG